VSGACPTHVLTLGGLLRGLPFTLAGVLVGLLSLGRPRTWEGLLIFHGRYGAAWLLLTLRGFSAITLGRVVITPQRELSPETLVHEQHHAVQFEHGGLLFVPLYLYWQARSGYWGNPFEIEAAQCAARFTAGLSQQDAELTP
jgi:hypothetical protein